MTAIAAFTGPRPFSMSRWFSRYINWQGIAALVILALVWEIVVDTGLVTFDSIPAPSAVVVAWFQLLSSGQLLTDTVHTLTSTFVGWIIGSVIGIVFGLWFGLSATARRFALMTAEVFRAAPGIVFVPVIILIFGFTITTEIVTVAYVSIWPVLVNGVAGARAVSHTHRDTAKTLHLSKAEVVAKITLPTSLPYIVTGMKLSLTTALALAVVTEMIGNPAGLGYAIIFFGQSLHPASMLAVIVWVGVLGILLNYVYEKISMLSGSVRANRLGV